VIKAVEETLKAGYRTKDIATIGTDPAHLLNTGSMGSKVIDMIKKVASHQLALK